MEHFENLNTPQLITAKTVMVMEYACKNIKVNAPAGLYCLKVFLSVAGMIPHFIGEGDSPPQKTRW